MEFAHGSRSRKNSTGFTLIEMMITVAIVGILAAIALPSYFEFVTRSKIIDGTTKLGSFKSLMDTYWNDKRMYVTAAGSGICGVANPVVSTADYFAISCGAPCPVAPTDTSYTICADGIAAKGMGGFRYTVTQTGAKASTGPVGWTAAPTCWALRKDGSC